MHVQLLCSPELPPELAQAKQSIASSSSSQQLTHAQRSRHVTSSSSSSSSSLTLQHALAGQEASNQEQLPKPMSNQALIVL
jgi:hypothetical protein